MKMNGSKKVATPGEKDETNGSSGKTIRLMVSNSNIGIDIHVHTCSVNVYRRSPADILEKVVVSLSVIVSVC